MLVSSFVTSWLQLDIRPTRWRCGVTEEAGFSVSNLIFQGGGVRGSAYAGAVEVLADLETDLAGIFY